MKASELERGNLGILLIGDPGSGKSSFISTMPKPLLVFNFDGKAGASTYSRAKDANEIELMMFEDISPDSEVILDFEDAIDELLRTEELLYASIALDSLTTYGEAEMRRAVHDNAGKGGARIGKIVPNQTDYLLQMTRVKFILAKLLSLPCNVAVAAHEALIEDKNGGLVGVVASVSGKKTLAKNLPSMFGEAYHTEQVWDRETSDTRWQIRCRGKEELSWCFSKLGLRQIIEPSWTEIAKVL